MTDKYTILYNVITTELNVMKHIREHGLTGYQRVDLAMHIQLLEDILYRAKLIEDGQ